MKYHYYCLFFDIETKEISLKELKQKHGLYNIAVGLCKDECAVARYNDCIILSRNKKLIDIEAKNIKQSWIDELKKQIKEIEEIPL